jgi:L,D-peptidoglycan transpeptidase YkuD (ErfK/YbiS/YcfS/YnhG family)
LIHERIIMKRITLLILLITAATTYGQDNALAFLEKISVLPLLQGSGQAILILATNQKIKSTTVTLFDKKDGVWTAQPDSFPASIGVHGFALIGEKKEGDGKTPSGVYTLSLAFGYAEKCSTKMPYRHSGTNDFWVDDMESPQYNTWVHGKPDAISFEQMRRDDILYKWGLVVDYNTGPIFPGKGSAIFLHVRTRPSAVTAGCAAFDEENILRVLKWLDPKKKPVVVMGFPDELLRLFEKDKSDETNK